MVLPNTYRIWNKCPAFIRNFICRSFSTVEENDNLCKSPPHTPVMVGEVIKFLNLTAGQVVLDMTFGAGGHSRALLSSAPNITLIALDRDPVAYQHACDLEKEYPRQVIPLLGKFSELPELLKKLRYRGCFLDGVLFDFGCSSMQFDNAIRGFSVSKDGPLDMRMDGHRFPNQPTAADVLAHATEEELIKIFKVYGQEKLCKKIARGIIEARYQFNKINTTKELCDLIQTLCSSEHRVDKLGRFSHTATKTFQALRIFVNDEVNEINYGMILAHRYLKVGGVCVAISFHSLEDTIVKRHMYGNVIDNAINPLPLQYTSYDYTFNEKEMGSFVKCGWETLTKHVIPSDSEVESNPRSRSAKLRAAVKVDN